MNVNRIHSLPLNKKDQISEEEDEKELEGSINCVGDIGLEQEISEYSGQVEINERQIHFGCAVENNTIDLLKTHR